MSIPTHDVEGQPSTAGRSPDEQPFVQSPHPLYELPRHLEELDGPVTATTIALDAAIRRAERHGRSLTDSELAAWAHTTRRSVVTHRQRLEELGVITEKGGDQGRRFDTHLSPHGGAGAGSNNVYWARVPESLMALDDERVRPATIAVYGAIRYCVDWDTGQGRAGTATLARLAHVSESTVKQQRKLLAELGYLHWVAVPGQALAYTVHDTPASAAPPGRSFTPPSSPSDREDETSASHSERSGVKDLPPTKRTTTEKKQPTGAGRDGPAREGTPSEPWREPDTWDRVLDDIELLLHQGRKTVQIAGREIGRRAECRIAKQLLERWSADLTDLRAAVWGMAVMRRRGELGEWVPPGDALTLRAAYSQRRKEDGEPYGPQLWMVAQGRGRKALADPPTWLKQKFREVAA